MQRLVPGLHYMKPSFYLFQRYYCYNSHLINWLFLTIIPVSFLNNPESISQFFWRFSLCLYLSWCHLFPNRLLLHHVYFAQLVWQCLTYLLWFILKNNVLWYFDFLISHIYNCQESQLSFWVLCICLYLFVFSLWQVSFLWSFVKFQVSSNFSCRFSWCDTFCFWLSERYLIVLTLSLLERMLSKSF